MAKRVRAVVKLQIPAGRANPAPPVGTALGPHGINIMDFCKAYNARTQAQSGQIIPAIITIFEDRSFTFELRTPPASDLLRKAAGVEKGAANQLTEVVGEVTIAQVREIAETKLPDLNTDDMEQAVKIIEGTVASVPPQGGRKHPHQDFIQINTSNILFIVGGAFEGLEGIVSRRTGVGARSLGFGSETVSDADRAMILKDVTHDDLLQFGLIPEFVGRLPVVSVLDPLDVDTMTAILTRPKNAVARQFQRLFQLDNTELVFTDDALRLIAEEAIEQKTGARGLRTVVEGLLLDVMYDAPSNPDIRKCVVSAETVRNHTRPLLVTESEQVVGEEPLDAESA